VAKCEYNKEKLHKAFQSYHFDLKIKATIQVPWGVNAWTELCDQWFSACLREER